MKRTTLGLTAALGLALAGTAIAQTTTDRNTDDVRHAAAAAKADPRASANTASLDEILSSAKSRYPGELVEVSYDDGKFDIEIRQADGRRVELEYSAQTGRLLETDYD